MLYFDLRWHSAHNNYSYGHEYENSTAFNMSFVSY